MVFSATISLSREAAKPCSCEIDISSPCDNAQKFQQISILFHEIFPNDPAKAEAVATYWIKQTKMALEKNQREGNIDKVRARVEDVYVITYADNIRNGVEATIPVLERFLETHFPYLKGRHYLPCCENVDPSIRFNDGGFSQVDRQKIAQRYGTNADFCAVSEKYPFMPDFILNHVDILHEKFQAYLNGDDAAGNYFYVMSEPEYQKFVADGHLAKIFRPRPFPLFTIFRRKPKGQSGDTMQAVFAQNGLPALDIAVERILYVFNLVKNDQGLLPEQQKIVDDFRRYLGSRGLSEKDVFQATRVQEGFQVIFVDNIKTREDLLQILKLDSRYATLFAKYEERIYGQEIRALTTFSHVQVDWNTSTREGLKGLADDYMFYLTDVKSDLIRLDAAAYAFKVWGTSCFQLPQLEKITTILKITKEIVAPNTILNAEVNDSLYTILPILKSGPNMAYDFSPVMMLPYVINFEDIEPLFVREALINSFELDATKRIFGVENCHDGKSQRGAKGVLTFAQFDQVRAIGIANGAQIKFKTVAKYEYPKRDFEQVCKEAGLDFDVALKQLFKPETIDTKKPKVKDEIRTKEDIARVLCVDISQMDVVPALVDLNRYITQGFSPYELCITTRDIYTKLHNQELEVARYMAQKALFVAIMGNNIPAIYFGDLFGLKSDQNAYKTTGEKRLLNRQKFEINELEAIIADKNNFEGQVAQKMSKLIQVRNGDCVMNSADCQFGLVRLDNNKVACISAKSDAHNGCSVVLVNVSKAAQEVVLDARMLEVSAGTVLQDHFSDLQITLADGANPLQLKPYQAIWFQSIG